MKRTLQVILVLAIALSPMVSKALDEGFVYQIDTQSSLYTRIVSSVVFDGAVYISTMRGLYRNGISGEVIELTAVDGYALGSDTVFPIALVCDDEAVFALAVERNDGNEINESVKLFQFILDGDAYALNECFILDGEDMSYLEYSSVIGAHILSDTLWLLIGETRSGEATRWVAFDMNTGMHREFPAQSGILGFVPYRNGDVLIMVDDGLSPPYIGLHSLDDGSMRILHEIAQKPINIGGLTYDMVREIIYYVNDGILYAIPNTDPTALQEVGSIPLKAIGHRVKAYILPDGRFFAYNDEAALILNPSAHVEKTVLTIANLFEMDAAYYAFSADHPETTVKVLDISDYEILSSMMTRSDEVDIYCVLVNESAYKAMYQRGYLDVIDELLPFTEGMLEQVTSRIKKDGHLVALPCDVSISGGLIYDPNILHKLGLHEDELPKDWSEFFDFISNWPNTFAERFPEISLFSSGEMKKLKQAIFYSLYNDYCTYMDGTDDAPSFDTPLFNQLLLGFEAVDYDAIQSAQAQDWLEEGSLFIRHGDVGFVSMRENANPTYSLMLEPGVGPFYGMTMSVYILNPYSKNRAAAVEYLRYAAMHMNKYTRFNLVPDEATPMRRDDYDVVEKNFADAMQELKDRLAATEEAKRPDLELELADLEKRWPQVERMLWTVTDDLIARYKAQIPGIVVYKNGMNGGFEGSGDEGVHSAIQRYLAGQMNRQAFIDQLDQKVTAMILEG